MKLVHALIAKSLAETILVAGLGIAFYLAAFPPYFHGWGEVANGGIAGWVVDQSAPWSRVEVQFFIDGKFAASATANLSRPDVVSSGWSRDEWHGYAFSTSFVPTGMHEARVYALHASGGGKRQSLQLLGDPIKFIVEGDGKVHKSKLGIQKLLPRTDRLEPGTQTID